jgi:hypothetical protein
MEPVPPLHEELTRAGRRVRLALCLALACGAGAGGGCLALDKFIGTHAGGRICQVVATWKSEIVYVPDPVRNGMPSPTLLGRVYLFDQQMVYPQKGDGTMTVSLYDDTPPAPDAPPRDPTQPLEVWKFDKYTLNEVLYKKDIVGMAYSIPLPWGTYRPDIRQVHVTVRYEPAEGLPLFSEGSPLTIEHTKPPVGASPALAAAVAAMPPPAPGPEHEMPKPHQPTTTPVLPMPRPAQ